MRRLLLLSLTLAFLAPALAEDPPPAPPEQPEQPPEQPPPPPPPATPPEKAAYDATLIRRWLEQKSQAHGWPLTFKEDDDIVAAGSCDAKTLEDGYKLSRQALDKACALLKCKPADLHVEHKMIMVYFAKKSEYMAYGQDQAKANGNEGLLKLLETIASSGGFVCLDPSYGLNEEVRRHLTVHNLGHQILRAYAKSRGDTPTPGWLDEGFPSWLDGVMLGTPRACCIAKVGYDDDQYEKRGSNEPWDRIAYRVVRDYKDGKIDPKTKKPAYTRLGNLMGTKFDKLTGADVAVSWCMVRDLAKKPEAFQAFVEALFSGAKQADAFHTGYKRSPDEYEKSWIKNLLDHPIEEPKKK